MPIRIIIIVSILTFLFNSCSSSKVEEKSVQKHYFYFDKTHPKMMIYGKKIELRHLYDLDSYDPIIFIPYDSIEKKIRIEELKKHKVKDYNWLNKLLPSEVGHFFFRDRIKKEFYLIEKRESNEVLYLRRVSFIQEID